MRDIAVVLVGEESLLAQCGEILLQRGHRIALVVADSPVLQDWARGHDLDVHGWGEGLSEQLRGVSFDWLFSIANLRMIPQDVLRLAPSGAVNFHDGPLPRYAGLNTPSWAILEGAETYGVTWHHMDSGIDTGDVVASVEFAIAPDETVLTLNAKCFEAGIASFNDLIAGIEADTLTARPQPGGERVVYRRAARPAGAGLIDFSRSASELSRLARALDFGSRYANPLVTPKIATTDTIYAVTALTVLEQPSGQPAGTVVSIDADGLIVAAADRLLRLEGQAIDGKASLAAIPTRTLPLPSGEFLHAVDDIVARVAPHEAYWLSSLAHAADIDAQWTGAGSPISTVIELAMPDGMTPPDMLASIVAFFARYFAAPRFAVAYSSDELIAINAACKGLVAASVPVCLDIDLDGDASSVCDAIAQTLDEARRASTFLSDIFIRHPGLRHPELSVGIIETADVTSAAALAGCAVTCAIDANGRAVATFDPERISSEKAYELADRIAIFVAAFAAGTGPVGDMQAASDADMRRLIVEFNDTEGDYDRTACVHQLIERQVQLTPDAVAVAFDNQSITYRELDLAADTVASALREKGVGPDMPVGLHVRRSAELVIGALGILKAGGAYVPLDPDFPADRLAMMVEDSETTVILTERDLTPVATERDVASLDIRHLLATKRPKPDAVAVKPEHLAYVIYTSGSTGRPKGVMIEHRNVVNFFAGMDERVPYETERQPVWLAVTSLSFDISVLELFWTLSRGFKVVIHTSDVHRAHRLAAVPATAASLPVSGSMDFGLFYWGNDDGVGAAKYRLLLEGAKFADAHGFTAIWTPERHFHAFGGPYPNPAVTGAAVAAVTSNLEIRAGSCVLPLHHPARVVEEWSVVDNLSNGRVGLAFASGWMPEDFVLRPENAPPANKAALSRDIETVRQLWRGEAVEFPMNDKVVSVVTQPRPVQRELPVWLTTAGNPESYREAANLGANVLTHLLGQSIDELGEKIAIYRAALAAQGRDPASHKVTLMLHTLMGDDREEVRELAREPMKDYLRSAAALIKQYAWAFPAFKKPAGVAQAMDIDLRDLDEDEMDAILDFAFQRYFEDSGLFGTVDDCRVRIAQLKAIGVDEVACLIDFGVATDAILPRLEPLARLVAECGSGALRVDGRMNGAAVRTEEPLGFAGEVAHHGVTHLQCTPSMARMFLADENNRHAMGTIDHLMIGGEPLSGALLAELRTVTKAAIENMYGPTETTIWSSTMGAQATDGVVPLGTPILNTQFYVLDRLGKPVPADMAGELCIGGDGVARGYLGRPDLTRERFIDNPLGDGRIYRTGDLVRFDLDGRTLRFIGRTDHQVKVRGYRIELGEIEARMQSFAGVLEAVAVVRDDGQGNARIIAYMRASAPVDQTRLRAHIAAALPEYMVPSRFIELDRFPLTPNAKVDRARLPEAEERPAATVEPIVLLPSGDREKAIAQAFARVLGLERIGLADNFFALGGHSLLAVHLHRDIKASIAPEITITDIFRFPTVAALAGHLANRSASSERLSTVADRAAMRRARLQQTAGARH